MSNSSLVSYTRLSPNNSGRRNHSIDWFIPHCVVGQCSVESLGEMFASPSKEASSNYGIGVDGRVALYVDESNRAWTTSSSFADNRGVTVECASDAFEPYAFNSAVYNKLIDLAVDVCRRNGKTHITWFGDRSKTLNYNPQPDEMVIAVHRWFANKSCPGDWLYSRLGDFAGAVNKKLSALSYRAHVQTYGWMVWVTEGQTAGTTGMSKRMEAVQFSESSGITAQAHCQTYGNMQPVPAGQICGTTGQGKRMEAIKLNANYKIQYRAHLQGTGWTDWVSNGEWCGTKGEGRRMEAIEVKRV